jgi:hypothetical protein
MARRRQSRRSLMLVACALAVFVAGCPKAKLHPVASRPLPFRPILTEGPLPPDIHPDDSGAENLSFVTIEVPAAPPDRARSANPKKSSADSSENNGARPTAPLISPQLSPAEQAALQRRTNESIATAENNLRQSAGRQLNPAQRELVEKINGFLTQAREALQDSDWGRAQNLAQKAQLLSIDLANSF